MLICAVLFVCGAVRVLRCDVLCLAAPGRPSLRKSSETMRSASSSPQLFQSSAAPLPPGNNPSGPPLCGDSAAGSATSASSPKDNASHAAAAVAGVGKSRFSAPQQQQQQQSECLELDMNISGDLDLNKVGGARTWGCVGVCVRGCVHACVRVYVCACVCVFCVSRCFQRVWEKFCGCSRLLI